MNRKGIRYGHRPMGTRHEQIRSVEKAMVMALYFAVVASGAMAVTAQLLGD